MLIIALCCRLYEDRSRPIGLVFAKLKENHFFAA